MQQPTSKSTQLHKMAKKKPDEKKVVNEIMHDYLDCPTCGGDMNILKQDGKEKLYKCFDCKRTETRKVK